MLVSQEKYKKTDFFSFALQREKELERKEKGKVIHLKYYKHLKEAMYSAKPFGQIRNGLVSGRLACTYIGPYIK